MIPLDPVQMPVLEFWTFLLIFVRFSALVVTAPVFGGRAIPPQLKVGLAALLSLALTPMAKEFAPPIETDIISFGLLIVKEAAVGVLMGFVAHIVFYAVQMAGQFIDFQLGLQMGQILDPSQEHTGGALSQFLYTISILLFLAVDGHHVLIRAFAAAVVPVGGSSASLPLGASVFGPSVLQEFNVQIGAALVTMVKLAAPAAIVLFCVDIAFAVLSRAVPTLNVFMVGLPAKILIGLSGLAAALGLLVGAIGLLISQMAHSIESIARALSK